MIERGSPAAVLIGRWGMALSLAVGAVVIGRVIRNFPYLLPNRLPGLALYELGPALVLALAIGTAIAIAITDTGRPRPGIPARLALFTLAALVAGTVTLAIEFDPSLRKSRVTRASPVTRVRQHRRDIFATQAR